MKGSYYFVNYVDDNRKKHIVIAKTKEELDFIKDRFENVEYEFVAG